MTSATIDPIPVPLRADGDGTLRVGSTRVLFDLVVRAFDNGATPESIVQAYDTLRLADVYAVVAYYLEHRLEVESYLSRRENEARNLRRRIEAAQPTMTGLRQRLMSRGTNRGQ